MRFRVAVALLSATFFQPDEYFQALEPAHKLVFGYGHLTWEWRSQQPIRSIFFPMLFVPVYWVLKVLGLDDSILLILAPKLVQGLFASITDAAICRLTHNVLGERYVSTALFLSLTSIFHLQALTRTLSNSLETSLTTLALSYWPFSRVHSTKTHPVNALAIAAVTCMIRPTNAIIWIFLMFDHSFEMRHERGRVIRLWIQASALGIMTCVFIFLVDSWYFGTPTFTPLNFLRTNLSSVSSFYGRSPWHYYVSQGIPMLCNISTPFVIHGMCKGLLSGPPPARRLAILILWTVGIYSLTAHKEWRFIHPLLPAMHVIASQVLVDDYTERSNPKLWPPPSVRKRWRIPIVLSLFLAPYMLFVQSRAQIAVMHYIRTIPVTELQSVGFLMPCHSTPWQSYLHRSHLTEHSLWALGCEPPLDGQDLHTYQDQSDVFYASPTKYLQTRFPATVDSSFPPSPHPFSVPGAPGLTINSWQHSWPSHLVMFGSLLNHDGVRTFLERLGYQEEWYGWNGWEQDQRRRGGVRVWSWKENNSHE